MILHGVRKKRGGRGPRSSEVRSELREERKEDGRIVKVRANETKRRYVAWGLDVHKMESGLMECCLHPKHTGALP